MAEMFYDSDADLSVIQDRSVRRDRLMAPRDMRMH